ncbi:MAG TPA: hypothetical protein VGD30_17250 [Telluria sp.]
MKAVCRNCHFLSKETRDPGTGDPIVFALNSQERKAMESAPGEVVAQFYALNCHMGVWDEGVSGSAQDRDTIINLTRRGSSCFFFPHHPAMLFAAAKELQKREADNEKIRLSNLYTRIGLFVAAGALCVNALVAYLKTTS